MPINTIAKTPVYNLRAVLNRTHLKADVLRAWERRYGLPAPQRTQGGHRLYSEYDIEIVRWLQARLEEGLSISHAVVLWKELNASGRDSQEHLQQANSVVSEGHHSSATQLDDIRRQWKEACLAFDNSTSETLLNQAFGQYSVEMVCVDILQKGIHEIGELWFDGNITVQQEHFSSDIVSRQLNSLINAAPNAIRGEKILIGCPHGEWHTLPVLFLTLFLRRKGFNVINLGANIPLDQLAETSAVIRPDLVIMTAQQLQTVAALRSAATLFQKSHLLMAFGGLIFNRIPRLQHQVPAVFLGNDLSESVEVVERIIASPPEIPATPNVDPASQRAAADFRVKAPLIDIHLLNLLQKMNIPGETLIDVNGYFGDRIRAALELGDITYVEPDLEWVEKLLAGHHLPADYLENYLYAYRKAVRDEMKEAGVIIDHWISSYLNKQRKHERTNLE